MTGLAQRDRPVGDAGLMLRVLAVFALFGVLTVATNWQGILTLRFPDPDDTLRLVQLRDLIAGQGWFDLTQHRINAVQGGVPMHWSRLIDVPLAAVILLLRPLTGQPAAEMAALIGVPLATFFCAMWLAARMAWKTLGRDATTLACLVLAMSIPAVSQMRPLRIDHHGWQIVLALLAANALMSRNPRLGGLVAGVALAAWMAISIEGLPLAAAFVGIAALRWLRRCDGGAWLVSMMFGLAGGSAAIFLGTRGLSDLATHCDAVSPVHLAIFTWGAAAIWGLAALRTHSIPVLLGGFAVVGAGALAIILLAAPQCAGGGFAELDPLVREYWYLNVAEGMPVWRRPWGSQLQIILPPAVGIWASFRLYRQSAGAERLWWMDYTLLLAASLAVAIMVTRAGAVAGALAAVPLGWQVSQWLGSVRKLRSVGRRVLAFAGVALVLLPAMPGTLMTMAMPAKAAAGAASSRVYTCNVVHDGQALNKLRAGEILAPLDIGPDLLYATHHSVIATSHHRGSDGMRQVIEGFIGTPEAAHALVRKRGTAYVVLCPDLVEPKIYARKAPDGFAAALLDGRVPAWLEPVPMPDHVALKAWRVKD